MRVHIANFFVVSPSLIPFVILHYNFHFLSLLSLLSLLSIYLSFLSIFSLSFNKKDDILASPSVFAQSVYNLVGINHIMNDVAKIDNLPDKHTIEALLLLRHAWSNVDAYTYYADHYKAIAKLCYFLMLLLGILIVSMGVILFNNDNILGITREYANLVTLALSLVSAIVAGYTSFMNPAARWHHLRSSALQLESQIWQFRTRTGKFRQNDLDARQVEHAFKTAIKDVEDSMLSGGDLKRTKFYR